MALPIRPPYPPMEAQARAELPTGESWQYEPKWDGFRCLAFRDGDDVQLQSKAGKPLARYFPDVVELLLALKPTRFVLDGEIVIPVNSDLSFDELLLRIHPAASRVAKLAAEKPANYIVFDLLVDERGKLWADEPLKTRRPRLEKFNAQHLSRRKRIHLSPASRDIQQAQRWFQTTHGGLDGVIAKRLDLAYQSGQRTGMQKIKNIRTADCVVGGFRYASKGKVVGSLLLGLHDEEGLLHHVGFTSALGAAQRDKLTPKLEKLQRKKSGAKGFTGRAPGGPSRWSTERTGDWQALPPELVVEVSYDHFSGGRFRHGTNLLRWRPDKPAELCTLDQIQPSSRSALKLVAP